MLKKTYVDIANIQIKNRQLDISYSECLLDTINSCGLIISDGKVAINDAFVGKRYKSFIQYLDENWKTYIYKENDKSLGSIYSINANILL